MSNEEQIYVCAVRYGLGRRTYITSVISDFLLSKKLSNKCKAVIIRDIEEAERDDNLGDNCDKESWFKLLNYLKNEQRLYH